MVFYCSISGKILPGKKFRSKGSKKIVAFYFLVFYFLHPINLPNCLEHKCMPECCFHKDSLSSWEKRDRLVWIPNYFFFLYLNNCHHLFVFQRAETRSSNMSYNDYVCSSQKKIFHVKVLRRSTQKKAVLRAGFYI